MTQVGLGDVVDFARVGGLAGVGHAVAVQLAFLRELNDIKRLYAQNLGSHSYATHIFLRATEPLRSGQPLQADAWCAAIVGAARLGAITPSVLQDVGIGQSDRLVVLSNSILAQQSLTKSMSDTLTAACDQLDKIYAQAPTKVPTWVTLSTASPRAGATCPGKPRIALEPAEMHSDHCIMVAVYAFLLADIFGADREDAWLIGLCHHLHNAYLPDAGFTGEVLLGDHLDRVISALRLRALGAFSEQYCTRVSRLFDEINNLASPLARAFHAADTIDRVVQMEHYERTAQFRVATALEEFNLVHEGAAQEFQHALLQSVGISYKTAL